MFPFFSLFELRPPVCGVLKECKAYSIGRQGVIDTASKTGWVGRCPLTEQDLHRRVHTTDRVVTPLGTWNITYLGTV